MSNTELVPVSQISKPSHTMPAIDAWTSPSDGRPVLAYYDKAGGWQPVPSPTKERPEYPGMDWKRERHQRAIALWLAPRLGIAPSRIEQTLRDNAHMRRFVAAGEALDIVESA
jgi:hypothetical protein